MYPNQPNNPPQVPPQPQMPPQPQPGVAPQPPVQPPIQTPVQPLAQPPMQPPAPQPSYGQPVYTGGIPQQPTNSYGNRSASPGMSKKKLLFMIIPGAIVAVAIVAFLVFGGARQIMNKFVGVKLEDYTNKNFGFSIQVPKGWEPKEYNEEFLKEVSFMEPLDDVKDQSEAGKHYASVRVDYKVANEDYMEKGEQEYFDDLKKDLRQTIDDQAMAGVADYIPETAAVETDEMTTVSGLKAYKVKLKISNYDGEKDKVGYEYGLFMYVDKKTQYEASVRAYETEKVNSKADSILTSFVKK